MTDNALAESIGVRVCFTSREGGVSEGAFAKLNLGSHVNDDPESVETNRRMLLKAWDAGDVALLNPNQVHGTDVAVLDDRDAYESLWSEIVSEAGCDGVLIDVDDTAALLCFADCVPVVLVSPTGAFAVVHAGWRGAVERIVSKAAVMLAQRGAADTDATEEDVLRGMNVYIGPHIGGCCFECGDEVHGLFVERFGEVCSSGERSIDLSAAIIQDLIVQQVTAERIFDCNICTECNSDDYFSYRASNGVCGRHGALVFRRASR